jgi:hypothetical protein
MKSNTESLKDVDRQLYSLRDAARVLGGVSVSALREHIRLGHLPVVRIGRRIFFDCGAIEAVAKNGLPPIPFRGKK